MPGKRVAVGLHEIASCTLRNSHPRGHSFAGLYTFVSGILQMPRYNDAMMAFLPNLHEVLIVVDIGMMVGEGEIGRCECV